jgi:hypothetical protein
MSTPKQPSDLGRLKLPNVGIRSFPLRHLPLSERLINALTYAKGPEGRAAVWGEFFYQHPELNNPVFVREVESALASFAQNSGKTAQNVENKPTNGAAASPTSWQEIEITFLSDHRVEICCGADRKTHNYGDLGFQDRRSGKTQATRPAGAWVMLCEIAKLNGTLQGPPAGKRRAMVQKRIEVREKLRGHFRYHWCERH